MSHGLLAHLQHALIRIATISPRLIATPPSQPRRASVALIIRVKPAVEDEQWLASKWRSGDVSDEDAHLFPSAISNAGMTTEARLRQFFSLQWVQRGTAELLFIKRADRDGDKWSSHVAFPGGRRDEHDEDGMYTAMRETWEEIGIDLAEKEFLQIGHLEDREITSSLGKRLLMILSPYVFLQLSPFSPTPNIQHTEVASLQWVPFSLLFTPTPQWGSLTINIARHAPQNTVLQWLFRVLIGRMDFRTIELPYSPSAIVVPADQDDSKNGSVASEDGYVTRIIGQSEREYLAEVSPKLQLWGLTLGMTLDFVSHMCEHRRPDSIPGMSGKLINKFLEYSPSTWLFGRPAVLTPPRASPSLTEVFPRFQYHDVNFWMWVLGWRYRVILRNWENSMGTEMEHSVHWSGLALAAFYASVRRALLVAILLRLIGLASVISITAFLGVRRINRARLGLPGFGINEIIAAK